MSEFIEPSGLKSDFKFQRNKQKSVATQSSKVHHQILHHASINET